MTRTLDGKEMRERGYVDIVGNLPLKKIEDEMRLQMLVWKPKEIIIRCDSKYDKATFYIPKEDFHKASK